MNALRTLPVTFGDLDVSTIAVLPGPLGTTLVHAAGEEYLVDAAIEPTGVRLTGSPFTDPLRIAFAPRGVLDAPTAAERRAGGSVILIWLLATAVAVGTWIILGALAGIIAGCVVAQVAFVAAGISGTGICEDYLARRTARINAVLTPYAGQPITGR